MNYSNELTAVNAKIEALNAQLSQLQKEQSILSQLVNMESKMAELAASLVDAPAQPEAVSETPVLSIVREEATLEAQSTVEISDTVVSNDNCTITIDIEGKDIGGDDHTDPHNQPRCYNQTWRSHKKAWKALKAGFTAETTMYQACEILRANGVRMRSYCSMD